MLPNPFKLGYIKKSTKLDSTAASPNRNMNKVNSLPIPEEVFSFSIKLLFSLLHNRIYVTIPWFGTGVGVKAFAPQETFALHPRFFQHAL